MEIAAYVFTNISLLDSPSHQFFIKNGFKLLKEKALEMMPLEELNHKVGLRALNNNIGNCITLQIILALYFNMLSVALSGWGLICNFFRRHIFAMFLPTF